MLYSRRSYYSNHVNWNLKSVVRKTLKTKLSTGLVPKFVSSCCPPKHLICYTVEGIRVEAHTMLDVHSTYDVCGSSSKEHQEQQQTSAPPPRNINNNNKHQLLLQGTSTTTIISYYHSLLTYLLTNTLLYVMTILTVVPVYRTQVK